ncbi:MAG: hypothetical protein KDD44_15035, partial [Bdellovibrionales bacterium]|nr:hypothetical protein [Bdellovibrionales bacterium]
TELSPSTTYCSLLRPLNELQIARHFAALTPFHRAFLSCNVGGRDDSWCGACPKCVFVWLMLSPFLSDEQLRAIWRRDLLLEPSTPDLLRDLVDDRLLKPLECVGTRRECRAALGEMVRRRQEDGSAIPAPIVSLRESHGSQDFIDVLNDFNDQHHVPQRWLGRVQGLATHA